jgi:hypothetical protein
VLHLYLEILGFCVSAATVSRIFGGSGLHTSASAGQDWGRKEKLVGSSN